MLRDLPKRCARRRYSPAWRRLRQSFQRWLEDNGMLRAKDLARIEDQVAAEIASAVDFSERGTLEPLEDLRKHVVSAEHPSAPPPCVSPRRIAATPQGGEQLPWGGPATVA